MLCNHFVALVGLIPVPDLFGFGGIDDAELAARSAADELMYFQELTPDKGSPFPVDHLRRRSRTFLRTSQRNDLVAFRS